MFQPSRQWRKKNQKKHRNIHTHGNTHTYRLPPQCPLHCVFVSHIKKKQVAYLASVNDKKQQQQQPLPPPQKKGKK
ncbi:hypothetical protein TRSC58_07326 [Trypanosoma rangeli SC58]|uniref:Uncharacterized protein n=1 Tax=Trypanosoma rangeli SC58 TaxID=429131 RepID=A0A061ITJ8_TRYRA|nr:hypothetical protein TRSC58_07326 [Trypanosoma rangeli SC58]